MLSVNDISILSGTIAMPLEGVWTADLVIDQPDGQGFDEGTAVTITGGDGFLLRGTVAPKRTGDFLDAIHVRVLGGSGGMSKPVNPRAFAQPGAYVRDVLSAISQDGGESLSSSIDQTFMASNLTAWMIMPGTVSSALRVLLDIVAPTFGWRIEPTGALWMGTELWAESESEFVLLERNPTEGTYTLGIDLPTIYPGTTLEGIGKISRVEHHILQQQIRSFVWTTLAQEDRGIRPAIQALVTQQTAPFDYYALYSGTVKAQSADLTTVDVSPDNAALGSGFQRIPLRHGLPGCKVQVQPGAKIRIGWDDGNPSQPFAALWNGGETPSQITISASQVILGDTGGEPAAKATTLNTWLSTHTHAVSGSTATASTLPTTGIAATNVQVK